MFKVEGRFYATLTAAKAVADDVFRATGVVLGIEAVRTAKVIRAEIRELKRGMKARGIKVSSFMNRHPSLESARANGRLFALKLELDDVLKGERDHVGSK